MDWGQIIDGSHGQEALNPTTPASGGMSANSFFVVGALAAAMLYFLKKRRDKQIAEDDADSDLQKQWNQQTWNAYFKDPFNRRRDGGDGGDEFDKIL